MFTSEITSRTRCRITFLAKSDATITYVEAKKAQDGHGYCADGYGCDGLSTWEDVQDGKNVFVATWGCYGSCD